MNIKSKIFNGEYNISQTDKGIVITGEDTNILKLEIQGTPKPEAEKLIEQNLEAIELGEYEIFNKIFHSIDKFSLTLDSDFGATDQVMGDIASELVKTFNCNHNVIEGTSDNDYTSVSVASFFSIEDKKEITIENGNVFFTFNDNSIALKNGIIKADCNEDTLDTFNEIIEPLKPFLQPCNSENIPFIIFEFFK
jgi:hypothetical protein